MQINGTSTSTSTELRRFIGILMVLVVALLAFGFGFGWFALGWLLAAWLAGWLEVTRKPVNDVGDVRLMVPAVPARVPDADCENGQNESYKEMMLRRHECQIQIYTENS